MTETPAFSSLYRCECGARTGVIDSRLTAKGIVRRRRQCQAGHRFTTYEVKAENQSGERIERMQKALEFYGEIKNYVYNKEHYDPPAIPVNFDLGNIAREALKE